jgi:hypothetical protein
MSSPKRSRSQSIAAAIQDAFGSSLRKEHAERLEKSFLQQIKTVVSVVTLMELVQDDPAMADSMVSEYLDECTRAVQRVTKHHVDLKMQNAAPQSPRHRDLHRFKQARQQQMAAEDEAARGHAAVENAVSPHDRAKARQSRARRLSRSLDPASVASPHRNVPRVPNVNSANVSPDNSYRRGRSRTRASAGADSSASVRSQSSSSRGGVLARLLSPTASSKLKSKRSRSSTVSNTRHRSATAATKRRSPERVPRNPDTDTKQDPDVVDIEADMQDFVPMDASEHAQAVARAQAEAAAYGAEHAGAADGVSDSQNDDGRRSSAPLTLENLRRHNLRLSSSSADDVLKADPLARVGLSSPRLAAKYPSGTASTNPASSTPITPYKIHASHAATPPPFPAGRERGASQFSARARAGSHFDQTSSGAQRGNSDAVMASFIDDPDTDVEVQEALRQLAMNKRNLGMEAGAGDSEVNLFGSLEDNDEDNDNSQRSAQSNTKRVESTPGIPNHAASRAQMRNSLNRRSRNADLSVTDDDLPTGATTAGAGAGAGADADASTANNDASGSLRRHRSNKETTKFGKIPFQRVRGRSSSRSSSAASSPRGSPGPAAPAHSPPRRPRRATDTHPPRERAERPRLDRTISSDSLASSPGKRRRRKKKHVEPEPEPESPRSRRARERREAVEAKQKAVEEELLAKQRRAEENKRRLDEEQRSKLERQRQREAHVREVREARENRRAHGRHRSRSAISPNDPDAGASGASFARNFVAIGNLSKRGSHETHKLKEVTSPPRR